MSHRVRIAASGHEFTVEEGETVLDAAMRAGVNLPYGCQSGACGACEGKVLEGSVHYDGPLPPALDEADAAQGVALFCQAIPETDLVIEVPEVEDTGDLEIKQLPAKVAVLEQVAHDVMLMKLRLPETERLQFLAGQYIDILLEDGQKRAFSMANAPHDDEFIELHIRHVPGGTFTEYVFTRLKPKDMLRIEGPHGSFYLREDHGRPIIMVAGGTGFAPLKAMIEYAFHVGLEQPIHLFRGVRALRDLYLPELAEGWAREHHGFEYTPVLSEPMPEDDWQGATGLVTDAVRARYPDLSGFDVYLAGPPAMVEAAREAFTACGLPREQLFSDAFEFASQKKK